MSDLARARIVIGDLRAPILSELQKAALAGAAANPVVISEQAVLDAACARTGLSNFGNDDFRARLRLWAGAANACTELTELARHGLFADMLRFAENRLLVEDILTRHPEILNIVIDRPLIVAGLPRSGTTYLQNFLSADDQLRALPYWEAIRPVPATAAETGDPASDPRYATAAESWARMDAMLPFIKAIHPFDPDHISEDIELQAIDFSTYYLEWIAPHAIWTAHYWATDQTPSYCYLKKVLQILTFFRGPNRWLLKCPQHMEQLRAVSAVFPDATIVLNHRDPVASIQSAITSIAYSSRIRTQRIDLDCIATYWIARYEKLLRACVRDRDALPEAQFEDVYFHKLMADPLGTVSRIYAKAALPLGDGLRARMARFLIANSRGKFGRIDYDLRRDFGLDAARIRERFHFYLDRFPMEVEVESA
jgi:hypothetical protein